MHTPFQQPFRLRSFVRRDGRKTAAQDRAYKELMPIFGLNSERGFINYEQVFGRQAPCFLEIGFGTGQSLLALAKSRPDLNLIGVETHKPGIGALLLGIKQQGLSNIRVCYGDVIDVLKNCIPDASLAGVQIFFPDPWPKRRHHGRRLIQTDFVSLIVTKLQKAGSLHLATDWGDYASHMLKVVSSDQKLINLNGDGNYAIRSIYRPILSKFETRALREGRQIWELQLANK